MPELPANAVADHGPADRAGHHEAGPRRDGLVDCGRVGRCAREVHDQEAGGDCPRCGRDQRAGSRRSRSGAATGRRPGARRSGREPRATLGPATRQDGATSAGAHPQAEPVGLRPPTIVRLERALAHSRAPVRRSGAEATCLSQNCLSHDDEPMAPAPVGRPRHREQWTAWTRDSGRRDGSTGSRYVRSSRLVKPNRARRPGGTTARATDGEPATLTASDAPSGRDTPPAVHIAAKKSTGCGQPLAGTPGCG